MYIPRKRSFWAVGLAHLTNDTFMSAGIVMLTFLSATVLPMTNTQIGLAISIKQLVGAVTQPLFGLRADRTGGRGIGAAGLAFVVICFLLALFLAITTRNYLLMFIPFVLQGIGSGAVHPVGALHAAEADSERQATNTSYFFLMGQTGLAVGPALVGLMLDMANQGTLLPYLSRVNAPVAFTNANVMPLFLLGFAAIPGVLFMVRWLPSGASRKAKIDAATVNATATAKTAIVWWPFIVIGVLVILRSLASPGSVNFIPVLFQEKGWTPAQYGLITSMFWLASGISGVVLGNLADRYDRRLIVMSSLLVAAPFLFILPLVDGPLAFAAAIAAGGFSGGAHSIIVVLAQQLIPNSKGFASGAILGFIFGSGALGSLLIGALADSIGLGLTFQLVAVVTVAAGLVSLLLPKNQRA